MENDELKLAWHELARRQEVSEARIGSALRARQLDKARSALRRQDAALIFELACSVIAVALIGSFLAEHFTSAKFALPALVLEIAALASIAANGTQLLASLRIDYAGAVIAIQRQIAEIRAARIRSTQWILLLAPLLWTPLAIVAARGLLDLDIYAELGPTVVALNLSVGLAVIPLGILAARMCAERLGHSPALRRLADSVAGNSLTRALESVDQIDRFQGEG